MPSNKNENKSKKSEGKQSTGRTRQLQTPAPSDGGHSPGPDSASTPPESSKDAQYRHGLQEKFNGSKHQASSSLATPAAPEEPATSSASAVPLSPVTPLSPTGKHVKFKRDPTQPGDYAPGAGDHDSNKDEDSEREDAPMNDVPIEDEATEAPSWVKQLIQNECQQFAEMDPFFNSDNPNYDSATEFFVKLNQKIRAINITNGVNPDIGTIPEQSYAAYCKAYNNAMREAKAQGNALKGWQAWHKTKDLLKAFNKRHYLPRGWNLREDTAESILGTPNPRKEEDSETSCPSVDLDHQNDADSDIEIPESVHGTTYGTTARASSLDALEARTRQNQRQLTSAKVMYWWPKGTGTQIFVRYGDRSTPIYRIRAGSHESYSRNQVERVLMTKTRGTAKVVFETDGFLDEGWKWERRHVEDFIGVGWKVEDDDESDIDALSLILPEKGAVYPQTRTLVKWKDGVYTLEGRAFIRRVTSGSSLDGDKVLYQKAKEMESAYRNRHGLDEIITYESDSDRDYRSTGGNRGRASTIEASDSSDDAERRRRIRTGKRALRSAPPRSTRGQSYITTDEEENGNYVPDRRRGTKQRENLSRKSQPPPRRRRSRSSTRDTDDERIRQLEEELRNLKTGRSKTQPSSRRATPAHSGSWSLPPARRARRTPSKEL